MDIKSADRTAISVGEASFDDFTHHISNDEGVCALPQVAVRDGVKIIVLQS